MDIKTIFNNSENMYYGHGIGNLSYDIVNSIMNNGLRCSHGSLYYTSIALCMGNLVTDDVINLMNNWPHKSSTIIVIVSLPNKYNILESIGLGTYNCLNAAFYYIPSKDMQEKYSLTNSNYVMPYFIKGYYDSVNNKFISNPKYYENLSLDEQTKIFELVKFNYISIINSGCGILKYRKVVNELAGYEFPLSNEEIEELRDLNIKKGR